MYKCEKCGRELRWSTPRSNLRGGVCTYLCTECSTEWDGLCLQHPSFQELRRLGMVMGSIVTARELSVDDLDPKLQKVQHEYLKCELKLRQVGLEWLGRES